MKAFAAVLLGIAWTTPVMARSIEDELDRMNRIMDGMIPVIEAGERSGQQYQYYVWTHLAQACGAGDLSACREQRCRINELNLRLDMGRASGGVRNAPLPRTGISCGPIQRRF